MTAPTTPRGFVDDTAFLAGTFGALLTDFAENVPELFWPQSVVTYGHMRRDPRLTAIYGALTLPVRRAPWHVDPMGARPQVAALVAEDFGLTVAGVESAQSGARVRGVNWGEHLRLALLDLIYGHFPFEELYEIRGGLARLVSLSERMPQTIANMDVDRQGRLVSVQQFSPTNSDPPIPANRLLWYVHEREGSAWQGRSVLRPAYAPWLLKREMQRIYATANRRQGMGIPVMEAQPGSNPTDQQMIQAQQLASATRVGETSGAAAPPGFVLRFKGVEGGLPDTLGFLKWLDQQMSTSALAGFLDLGSTETGSRALGESFIDLFLLTLQSLADEIAEQVTSQTVARLVAYNFGEDEPVPAIRAADVGSRREVTAEALTGLLASGALSADPALESWVRSQWRLPARETPPPPPAPAPQPPAGPPPAPARGSKRPARRTKAAASSVLRRQPTLIEGTAGTDFEQVQAVWVDALDALAEDWADITRAQRQQILDQVRAAVDDGQIDRLAGLAVDSAAAAVLLASAMSDLADSAAKQMRAEAKGQGVAATGTPDDDRLAEIAATVAALAAASLAQSAARKGVQAWTPNATPAEVTDAVAEHLDSLTDAALRDYLGAGLSAAQNEGRLAVLRDAPEAAYYASETLDRNTCDPCSDVDTHQFDSLGAAEQAYANGGYSQCLGGLRCRGIVVAVWDQQ